MEKPADTTREIHDLIRRRWSPRAFADTPVDPQTLEVLFEAARWAPSCFNDQPWEFLVAEQDGDSTFHQQLLMALVEDNRVWAKHAPVLGCSIARTEFNFNGKPNDHARHDVGLAMENLVLEALNQGLYVHQMAGFDPDTVREEFSLPDNREPVAMFALGYPGDPEQLPEELAEAERSSRERKSRDQFVFTEDNPADWS